MQIFSSKYHNILCKVYERNFSATSASTGKLLLLASKVLNTWNITVVFFFTFVFGQITLREMYGTTEATKICGRWNASSSNQACNCTISEFGRRYVVLINGQLCWPTSRGGLEHNLWTVAVAGMKCESIPTAIPADFCTFAVRYSHMRQNPFLIKW